VTPKPTNTTGTHRADLDGLPAVIADGLLEALRVVDAAGLPDDLRPVAFDHVAAELIPRRIVEHGV
jgi:hypothetical protein